MHTRFPTPLTLAAIAVLASAASPLHGQKATKDAPFVNSLKMEFVPVPGTTVLFCRTETRVRDFAAYVTATGYKQEGGVIVMKRGDTINWELSEAATWRKPGFDQRPDHPVVGVNWNEARAFCAWLSQKEGKEYRLPTDDEWSGAVGPGKYPWGNQFPPPKNAGNYADKAFIASLPGTGWEPILGAYNDGVARTAAVASYAPNRLGIYDLGGNVWEWCEDEYKPAMNSPDLLEQNPSLQKPKADDGTTFRVLRGASWGGPNPLTLLSAYRFNDHPVARDDNRGFRCVLVVSNHSAAQVAVAQPAENQYYQIKNVRSQKVLGIAGRAKGVDKAQIVQRAPAPYEGQQWRFVKVGSFYKIINRVTGLAMNVQGASLEGGAPIIQWDATNDEENQQWSVEDKGGRYLIRARHSGLVLDVANGTADSNAPLIQYPAKESDNDNQLFELVPVKK